MPARQNTNYPQSSALGVSRFFNWLGFAEQQRQEDEDRKRNQEQVRKRKQEEDDDQQNQQQGLQRPLPQNHHHGIPPEFPQIVYKTLRFYPDAMKSLARAIKEFYDGMYIGNAEICRQPQPVQTPQQEPPDAA